MEGTVGPAVVEEAETGVAIVDDGDDDLRLEPHLAAVERRLIRRALERTAGNRSEAARLLGISRQGLYLKLERLEIEVAPTGVGP